MKLVFQLFCFSIEKQYVMNNDIQNTVGAVQQRNYWLIVNLCFVSKPGSPYSENFACLSALLSGLIVKLYAVRKSTLSNNVFSNLAWYRSQASKLDCVNVAPSKSTSFS